MLPEIKIKIDVKGQPTEPVEGAEDVAKFLRKMYDADTFDWQEEFIMLCLNQGNQIIGYYKVSRGGT